MRWLQRDVLGWQWQYASSVTHCRINRLPAVQSWTSLTAPPAHIFIQVIQVNLTSLNPKPITAGAELEFTYSVAWTPSAIPFARRFERYLDYNFFEHQVRTLFGGFRWMGQATVPGPQLL